MSTNRNYKKAALITLRLHGSPLVVERIVELAIETGELVTYGKTPENTMRARLSEDIRRNGKTSLFVRTAPNKFGLREWDLKEFQTKYPIKKIKEEEIICLPQEVLRFHGSFFGFSDQVDKYIDLISVSQIKIFNRQNIECRDDYKQLIVYTMLVNDNNEVPSFTRGSYSTANKESLQGSICIGFGGHINKSDFFSQNGGLPFLSFKEFGIKYAAIREIAEELSLSRNEILHILNSIKIIGIINDDSSIMGVKHFCIVLKAKLSNNFCIERFGYGKNSEKSITQIKLFSETNLWKNFHKLEFWSQLICKALIPKPSNYKSVIFIPNRKVKINGPLIIVGEISAGKTTVTKFLEKKFKLPVISSGKCVSELVQDSIQNSSERSVFSSKAFKLIKNKSGQESLARKILEEAKLLNSKNLVIDGIRNISVINHIAKYLPSCKLIYIDSPRDLSIIRYVNREGRNIKDIRDIKNSEVAAFREIRDHQVEMEIILLRKMANLIIYNGGTLDQLFKEISERFYL